MKTNIHVLNVGHGDSLLVRVQRSSSTWTMLIDGGRANAGVGARLKALIPAPVGGKPRIDLMVASHHDQDHLEGLVALIKSDEYDIGQAWAPVIFEPRFNPVAPRSGSLTLTQALLDDEKAEERVYAEIEFALRDLDAPDIFGGPLSEPHLAMFAPPLVDIDDTPLEIDTEQVWGNYPNLSSMVQAGRRLGAMPSCGQPFSGVYSEDFDPLEDAPRLDPSMAAVENHFDGFSLALGSPPQRDHLRLMAMATTKAAFNVALTAEFIREARKRGIPTTAPLAQLQEENWCQVNRDGLGPWKDQPIDRGLRIELLAPTKWLAQKLQEKLTMPPGTLRLAMAMNSVTVPNRVSYVFNLHASKATALFTGDSGFTDFHEGGHGNFFDDRVARIGAAGWIKVPHHAGHFHRFGRAVTHLREGLGESTDGKWFVTSLGKKHKNPSLEFEELARTMRQTGGSKPIFDFTNGPQTDRFDAVCAACPRAGIDGNNDLQYASTNSGGWRRIDPKTDFCCTNYR